MILQQRHSHSYALAGRPDADSTPTDPHTDEDTNGRMRIELNVPRDVFCPFCETRMTPASTPKLFRWFKCRTCGTTHRHWREFEWVDFSRSQ